jgi:ComF family protein
MIVKKLKEGILEVLFPDICTVCGLKLSDQENAVCNHCLNDKFEEAGLGKNNSSSGVLLPEGILLQHALWNFDKGGHLQDLLHQLKYSRLTGVGVDLGRQLGKSLLKNPLFVESLKHQKVRLVPVPLHPRKRRMRGYNQAFHIAKGVADVTNLYITKQNTVVRTKNTSTQTGFTLEKRRKNIEGAFNVNSPSAVEEVVCVIIDDVFTTGATTFELAANLNNAGSKEILIATVAQA